MLRSLIAPVVLLLPVSLAPAVDLTVASVEITQGLQDPGGTLALIARNPTLVRVRVGVADSPLSIFDVDAELRVYADGIEIPGSPFFSINGPILAPVNPNMVVEHHTINFLVTPPQSDHVDFAVTLNPLRLAEESDYENNTATVVNKKFLCRSMVGLSYVSINYVPGGGQPNASLIEPGRGDAMLRGIYKTGDWNYHRSPLGSLTWTQNINGSNNSLLNTLNDIRNNQIPAAGYAKPVFIYGWLPGNPYSGNGQANGIPGSAGFGNTEINRYQRTFAHEVGHLWGQQHNNVSVNSVAFDVVRHLRDPLGLGPIMPATKKDVMVAGLLTADAWVAATSYNKCINDNRAQCSASDSEEGDGGAGDLPAGERCLRVSGELHHADRRVDLVALQRFDVAEPTQDDPNGDVVLRAYDARGALLHSVRIRSGSSRECCSGHGLLPATPLYAFLPESIANRPIHRVELAELRTNRLLAQATRSPAPPVGEILSVNGPVPDPMGDPVADPAGGMVLDPDGDALTAVLLYSPDGGNAWYPIGVNIDVVAGDNLCTFPSGNLPRSLGANALVKLRVSDGFNVFDQETPLTLPMGVGSPPDVHVIAPDDGIVRPQFGSVVLQASAWDMEDQLLPEENILWTSDLDGPLGMGRLFTIRSLSPGQHVLTVTGTDLDGMSASRTVTVTVTPRSVRSADLNFDGAVDGSDLGILLGAWGGGGMADLNLDGVVDGADLGVLLGSWG